jgi:hypothetical protein
MIYFAPCASEIRRPCADFVPSTFGLVRRRYPSLSSHQSLPHSLFDQGLLLRGPQTIPPHFANPNVRTRHLASKQSRSVSCAYTLCQSVFHPSVSSQFTRHSSVAWFSLSEATRRLSRPRSTRTRSSDTSCPPSMLQTLPRKTSQKNRIWSKNSVSSTATVSSSVCRLF